MNNENNEIEQLNKEVEQTLETPEPKKKSKIVLLLILLILLLSIVIMLIMPKKTSLDDYWFDEQAKNGIMEGRSAEDVQGILNSVVEKGMFNVSINPEPVFTNGSSQGYMAIENIKGNHYYTRVSVTIDETGEEVFKSKGIKPGQYIDYVKLEKKLSKGIYPAIARFIITDPNTLQEIGSVATQITINILN